MPGIGVITNPKARRNLRRPWMRDLLTRIVGDAGYVYETRSIDELPKLAEEFIERDLDILVVNGGDGTTHIALSNFIPVYGNRPLPKVLSLRGGTMNTISTAIKHKGNGEDILASVVKKVRAGTPLDMINQPLLKVNDRYGFMFGYGLVGNFLEAYYKGTTLGPWQATKVVTRTVLSAVFRTQFAKSLFASCPTRLTVDGRTYDMPECKTVLSASIKEIGIGFKLTYRAYEKSGHVHIRVTSLPPHKVAPLVPRLFLGRDVPGMMDELAKEVIAETVGNPPYTVDGELYRDTNLFHITQGPILKVIREGCKKPPAGIGLPEGDYRKALSQSSKESESDVRPHGSIDIRPYLQTFQPAR